MKVFSAIVILLAFTGCYSASKPEALDLAEAKQTSQLFFEIQGTAPSGVVKPTFKDNVMNIATLKVTSWPLSELICHACEVSSDREFHPDGPTQWVNIKGHDDSILLVSSYQPDDYITPWHFTYQQNHMLIEDRNAKLKSNVSYYATLPKSITGSHCQLIWFKREKQTQQAVHISDDVADYKTQFVLQCKH